MPRNHIANLLTLLIIGVVLSLSAKQVLAQQKPRRAKPPEFRPGQFDGIFFADVSSVLKGKLPRTRVVADTRRMGVGPAAPAQSSGADTGGDDLLAWHKLISPVSLEDLVKGAKLRLDKIVTTPAAFAGGGFRKARTEFSLLALMFAIVESYPEEVRWKKSATTARMSFARVAANTKIGSRQVYDEAKKRLLDLGDMLNGSTLTAAGTPDEIDWSRLMDRGPLMRLLEWSQDDYVSSYAGSESQFADNRDELKRYAELIAILGKTAMAEDMPDATDSDYIAYSKAMIEQAKQISLAVDTNNPELARQASGQLGLSCTNCHDNFR